MSSCYLCGVNDNHSNDCPNYVSPTLIVQKQEEQVSSYPPSIRFTRGGKTWRIAIITIGDWIPEWVTHGWYLNDVEEGADVSNSSISLELLAKCWENADYYPWLFGRVHNEIYKGVCKFVAVFGID